MKIKSYILSLLTIIILANCGQKPKEEASEPVEYESNQALYNEVMKVHDEVMPKMNDIYKLKEDLKNKIANTPDLAPEKKNEIDAVVSELDSASENMMVWMREFNPPADSTGEEKAREYLESEMEKVKKVKEDILESLEKGNNLKQ